MAFDEAVESTEPQSPSHIIHNHELEPTQLEGELNLSTEEDSIIETVYRGEGTIEFTAFYPYKMKDVGGSNSFVVNGGDIPCGNYEIYASASTNSNRISCGGNSLVFSTGVTNQRRNIKIDGRAQTIMMSSTPTGTDYNILINKYITDGTFFKIPCGATISQTGMTLQTYNAKDLYI